MNGLDLARRAAINLDVHAIALPPGQRTPYLFMARVQLEEAIAALEGRPPPAGTEGRVRAACAMLARPWPWRHGEPCDLPRAMGADAGRLAPGADGIRGDGAAPGS